MKTTIVTTAYNAERYLAETIESVLAQSIPEWEMVIVDDGSKDGTLALARRYAQRDERIRVVTQPNSGPGAGRNRGFAEGDPQADFVTFLDADDLLEPDALEMLRSALVARPEAIASHGLPRFIDSAGRAIDPAGTDVVRRSRRCMVGESLVTLPHAAPTTLAVMAIRNPIHTPGQSLIRRSALEQIGPLETTMNLVDWDMFLRLTLHGDLVYVDKVVLAYRQHTTSMSRKRGGAAGDLYIRRKLLSSPELTQEQRRIAAAGTVYSQRYNAALRIQWALSCLADRNIYDAARHIRHAVLSYVRFRRWRPMLELLG